MTDIESKPLYNKTYSLFGENLNKDNFSKYLDILVKYGIIFYYTTVDSESHFTWNIFYSQKYQFDDKTSKSIKYWKDDVDEWQITASTKSTVDKLFETYPHLKSFGKKMNGTWYFNSKFIEDLLESALNEFTFRRYDKMLINFDPRNIPVNHEDLVSYDIDSHMAESGVNDIPRETIEKKTIEEIGADKTHSQIPQQIIEQKAIEENMDDKTPSTKPQQIIDKNAIEEIGTDKASSQIPRENIEKKTIEKTMELSKKRYNILIEEKSPENIDTNNAKIDYQFETKEGNTVQLTFTYDKNNHKKISKAFDKCMEILTNVIGEL